MSAAQAGVDLGAKVAGLRREAARLEAIHLDNLKSEASAREASRVATCVREQGERVLAQAWESESAATLAWNVARERERTEELARRAKVLPAIAATKGGAS